MRGSSKVLVALIGALGLVACGGGSSSEGGGGGATSGGETTAPPPRCAVSGAPAEATFEQAEQLEQSGDVAGAIARYDEACQAGNPCACAEHGFALAMGEGGIAPEVERGDQLLARGCEGGDMHGCYLHGEVLFRLLGHAERGRDALAVGCEGEDPDACFALGRMAMSGIGGSEDATLAASSYQAACEAGHVLACAALGEAHVAGLGVEVDEARGRELLSWACESGSAPVTCRQLAVVFPGDEGAAAAMQRACEGGDGQACDALDASLASRTGDVSALGTAIPEGAMTLEISSGDLQEASTTIETDIEVESLGLRPTCTGRIGPTPGLRLTLAAAGTLDVSARGQADTVLVIRGPDGRWFCDDDLPAGVLHPGVEIADAAAGEYLVWVGGFDAHSAGRAATVHARME